MSRLRPYRFRMLLCALVGMLVARALLDDTWLATPVLVPLSGLTVAGVLFALSDHRLVLWVAALLALPILGAALVGETATRMESSGFHAPLFCFAALALTGRVLMSRRVDADTVAGSVCAFVTISVAFASVFTGLELARPGSFAFVASPDETGLFGTLSYFSLVTITTLGYGDVTPVSPIAIALVTLEPVVGVLFLSFVVARIISLVTSGGGRPFASEGIGLVRRPGRFELIILFAVAAIAITPFTTGEARLGILLHATSTALLVAAIYAGVQGAIGRLVSVVLGVLTTVLRFWPGMEIPAMALQLAFLTLVSGALAVWLARSDRVTRDMLLASISLYLILGFAFSSAFSLMELLSPGSVRGPMEGPVPPSHMLYYSFMTLTTTGFGEYVPAADAVERVANLAALVGVFYPPVLVGRLVALYETEDAESL
ncbi:MAG: ion channel [Myxococcota bacterium]